MLLTSYEDVVRRDRPAGWWRADANGRAVLNSGTTTSRLVPASSITTPSADRSIPGVTSGAGFRISGNQSNVNLDGYSAESTVYGVTDFVTFEAWVRPHTTFSNVNYGIVYRGDNSENAVGLFVSGTRKAMAYSTRGPSAVSSVESLQPNDWNHCVAIFPYNNNGTAQVWLNGRRASATFSFGAISGWGHQLHVGRPNSIFNLNPQSPPAVIAEPAVYAYGLTPSQINDHYTVGRGTVRKSMVYGLSGYPFPQTSPPPPPPSGLTPITEGLPNRRVLLVSDRPR